MAYRQETYPLPNNTRELYESFSNPPKNLDDYVLLSGGGNIPLAEKTATLLGQDLYIPCSSFPNGESKIKIEPNLRGRSVFVIQSMFPNPNQAVQEMVLMGDAIEHAAAAVGETRAVLAKTAYDRQDRKTESREPVAIGAVARQLKYAGYYDSVFSLDIHAEQSMATFPGAWDNAYGSKVLVPAIDHLALANPIVVAPDAGSAKRAEKFGHKLDADVIVMTKSRQDAYNTRPMDMPGDVQGKDVILPDDVISTGTSIQNAAVLAKDRGANSVVVVATHGEFVPDKNSITLPERLQAPDSPIDRLLITDTIYHKEDIVKNEKVDIVSVAPMLAVAILCYLTDDSIGARLIR